MIRDRGLKKWQAASFLPQQWTMLKGIYHDDTKVKKPVLDEQQLEDINIIVMDSLNYTLPIKVTIWSNGFFIHFVGIVTKVDSIMMYILIEINNNVEKIMINDITGVERV
ncbi:YolD-like family protein [Cytobacillus praedii]|uniref:YolD-like family protein n=1 Tax=Cytobacillus praedii TaxID=1742358 RepID=A0A4R1AVS3_9BACI|nr:YolD-like family protein [Cytobacillus praedii]TCJ04485.1 YolD-like family protein [Cytobacillus praedii]